MTIQILSERDAELFRGGCVLPNPSEVYDGTNYGQAKKDCPYEVNPSMRYPCDTNYGQYLKGLT